MSVRSLLGPSLSAVLLVGLVGSAAGCLSYRGAPATVDESRIGRRLHADPKLEVLALRGDETGRVVARDRRTGRLTVLADGVVDAVWGHGALFAVLDDGGLWKIDRGSRTQLLRNAKPGVALLGDGSVIAVGGAGTETDLFRIDARGISRKLAPAPGADLAPLALDDGRVAFVSHRLGAPAMFVVGAHGGAPRLLAENVPLPAERLEQLDGAILLRDPSGSRWQVRLADGGLVAMPSS